MPVKSKTIENPSKSYDFPKLMEAKYHNSSYNFIVLFKEPKIGMVVSANTNCVYSIGVDSTSWDMTQFTDYQGPVTLENY